MVKSSFNANFCLRFILETCVKNVQMLQGRFYFLPKLSLDYKSGHLFDKTKLKLVSGSFRDF